MPTFQNTTKIPTPPNVPSSPLGINTPTVAQVNDTDVGTEENPMVVKPEQNFEKPTTLVTWRGLSRAYQPRNAGWFVSLFAISALVLVLLFVIQQWTLMLAIIAFVFSLVAMNWVEPNQQNYAITNTSIKIGTQRFSYEKLKWFWFEKNDHQTVLYVSAYRSFPHMLELPLPQDNVQEVHDMIENALLKYLPYHEEGEANWLRSLDGVISRITPWLPASAVSWYANRFHK